VQNATEKGCRVRLFCVEGVKNIPNQEKRRYVDRTSKGKPHGCACFRNKEKGNKRMSFGTKGGRKKRGGWDLRKEEE